MLSVVINRFQAALEPVFTLCIGRFDDIKARIQGKKRSKVGHLASIFNAVAAFLGYERCLWKEWIQVLSSICRAKVPRFYLCL